MKKILKSIAIALIILITPMLYACNEVTVVNILKTGTKGNVDTYTIYYSNNTTSTFEVNNGQKTIINIEKTLTSGNVDTYTIYYSDNTTSNFQITNGKDGKDGEDGLILTIKDIYEEWKKTLSYGEDDSFDAFLSKYVQLDESLSFENAVSKAMTSAVCVFSEFKRKVSGFTINSSQTTTTTSAGAGVIYQMSENDKLNGDCYIVTNYHVVYDSNSNNIDKDHISENIKVYLYGQINTEKEISATYIGGSMTYDIAILKVTNSNIIKNSNVVECEISTKDIVVGQDVVAIGNPEGDGFSVTKGICSVDNESVDMTLSDGKTESSMRLIRIDAPVNPGNSGGGLFDSNGKLIGIVNAKLVDSQIDCVGYAIPKEVVSSVFNKVLELYVDTPVTPKFAKLGLSCIGIGYETYYDYDLCTIKSRQHIVVVNIISGGISSTLQNGFQLKDRIISAEYNGKTYNFNMMYDLSNFLMLLDENAVIKVKVERVVIPEDNNKENANYVDLEDESKYTYEEYEEVEITISYNSSYFS